MFRQITRDAYEAAQALRLYIEEALAHLARIATALEELAQQGRIQPQQRRTHR